MMMSDAPVQDEASGEEGDHSERIRNLFAEMVDGRIREAINARIESGIEDVWEEAEDLFEGRDALTVDSRGMANIAGKRTSTQQRPADGSSRILLNIIKPKTASAASRVQEMLVPHDERPWELKPTPVPELDEAVEKQDEREVALADGKTAPAALVAQMLLERARQTNDAMADWIEDQFVEGPNDRKGSTVYAEMRKVIAQAAKLGTGALKGPYMISTRVRRWRQGPGGETSLTIEERERPTSKCVDIRDVFPDPNCGDDIHKGEFLVEREFMTARQLRDLARNPRYDATAIGQAILAGPTAFRQTTAGPDLARTQALGVVQGAKAFEVYHYYGDVAVDVLNAMQTDLRAVSQAELALASVPCVVTMCNGEPIRVSINPLESGAFPIDLFAWEAVSGQPWGRGVPTKAEAAQRILTASVRRMMENAGTSAGPQVVKARNITPANQRNEIVGRKLWDFVPDELCDDVRKAFAVFNIPSMQRELMEILRMALEMVDQLTNLPLLLQGMVGAAPDTLGGMQMLMTNATSPLRVIAKQYDDSIVYPHLSRYYDLGMQIAPAKCRGDSTVVPRGSTALVQREMAREVLAQLYPVSGDPELKINKAKLIAEMCKAHGFNFATVQYTDAEWAERQKELANQPPPVDPQLQVAQIRSQAMVQVARARMEDAQQDRAFKAQENAQDRIAAARLQQIERDIEMMRLAGHENISLSSIKAMLSAQVMKDKTTREVKAADYASRAQEMRLAEETGSGI